MENSTNEWEPPKRKPVYATYSFWFLLALIVALIIVSLDTAIKVYKLEIVIDYIWNSTMNTSIYDVLRSSARFPIEDFIPFK